MNKKGDLTGVIYLVISIAAFAIFLLIVGYVVPLISNELAGQIGISEEINHSLMATTAVAQNTLPTIWIVIFVSLLLGLFATSFFIQTHPVFIPIYVLLLIVAILVAIPLSNAYVALTEEAVLAGTANRQLLIDFFMSKLPLVTFIIGLIALVITFAKPGGGEVSLA